MSVKKAEVGLPGGLDEIERIRIPSQAFRLFELCQCGEAGDHGVWEPD